MGLVIRLGAHARNVRREPRGCAAHYAASGLGAFVIVLIIEGRVVSDSGPNARGSSPSARPGWRRSGPCRRRGRSRLGCRRACVPSRPCRSRAKLGALALGGQVGAAAVSSHDEARHGHRPAVVAVAPGSVRVEPHLPRLQRGVHWDDDVPRRASRRNRRLRPATRPLRPGACPEIVPAHLELNRTWRSTMAGPTTLPAPGSVRSGATRG